MIPSQTEKPSTTFADAQREMRFAYYGGAPGMLTSAAVWLNNRTGSGFGDWG